MQVTSVTLYERRGDRVAWSSLFKRSANVILDSTFGQKNITRPYLMFLVLTIVGSLVNGCARTSDTTVTLTTTDSSVTTTTPTTTITLTTTSADTTTTSTTTSTDSTTSTTSTTTTTTTTTTACKCHNVSEARGAPTYFFFSLNVIGLPWIHGLTQTARLAFTMGNTSSKST